MFFFTKTMQVEAIYQQKLFNLVELKKACCKKRLVANCK
jgi:hypothetical protein